MKKQLRADLLLFGILLAIGLVLAAVLLLTGKRGSTVCVRVNGTVTASFPLSEDREYEIAGVGGTNLLVIENGSACIREADCPDALCVSMGKITKTGQTVVCLPHCVVVEICGGGEAADVDAVSG